MKLRLYRDGDLHHVLRRAQDDEYGDGQERTTKQRCEKGNTFVIEHDGIPVGIIGIEKIWSGVAKAWTLLSDQVGIGVELTKMVRGVLGEYCEANEIRRCEAAVKSELLGNGKWLVLIGFQYECTHREAAPDGGDLDVYVRFYG